MHSFFLSAITAMSLKRVGQIYQNHRLEQACYSMDCLILVQVVHVDQGSPMPQADSHAMSPQKSPSTFCKAKTIVPEAWLDDIESPG